MRGADTGVKPVPPTMRESKLNCIPVEGVVIDMPAISDRLFFTLLHTFNELGLLGLINGVAVELNIIFLAGKWKMSASMSVMQEASIISVLTRPVEIFS